MLASCGGREEDIGAFPVGQGGQSAAVQDFPVKLGAPFKVGNINYTPEDTPNYDDVGYASWYGAEMEGRPTANGEPFVAAGISGAHKTLPLPSYVEVTALDTGRTILVRINDRGPFANDRLIDLSEGAARQLGLVGQGVAGVRVRRVNPPEQDRSALRGGIPAASRMDTPESLLKVLRDRLSKQPRPAVMARTSTPSTIAGQSASPASADSGTVSDRFVREVAGGRATANRPPVAAAPAGYVVQIAAFSSRASADRLARQSGGTVSASADGRLFRVRYGPFASEAEAENALNDARQRGYPQARLLRD
jgi:rare lipoprotein A